MGYTCEAALFCAGVTGAAPARSHGRPRKVKKATAEAKAAAAAGFGDAKVEETIPINTGTPLKARRDE